MNKKNLTLSDLEKEFLFLRKAWREAWMGLPAVTADCLRQLGHDQADQLSPGEQAIYACMMSVAATIEEDGKRRGVNDAEPAYHNRLHIADTLVSMTSLLLLARDGSGGAPDQRPAKSEWLLMLAMLGHDFLHTGQINQFPAEIEQASVDALQPFMQASGMSEDDSKLVSELILMTEASRVAVNHQKMEGKPFDINDFDSMALLLQECDILASSLPEIGVELTHQLAREWGKFSEPLSQSLLAPGSRIVFLRNQARFTSPASHRLGIPALIEQEIVRLKATDVAVEKLLSSD